MNTNNQELKDYTDQELIGEIIKRIDNLSLKDVNCLIYPFVIIGGQYLKWYEETKKKKSTE